MAGAADRPAAPPAAGPGEPLAGPDRGDVLRYDPGQNHTVVGDTDATTGPRVHIGGHGPHTLTVALRARRPSPVV
ncbi:hypothetical protein ACIQWL_26240 [Streptomyces mirabilis]|uniref:hypothetical protein n=1 Tax=Streptomyces TaxID=1883 RepID=UPI0015EEA12A|nr:MULTISPECIES: hypothetical protein [Streptomyces]KAF5992523.1 hypothetical protein BOG92_012305 [Streptomyces sp. WAC00263]